MRWTFFIHVSKNFFMFITVQKLWKLTRFFKVILTNVLPPFYGSQCIFLRSCCRRKVSGTDSEMTVSDHSQVPWLRSLRSWHAARQRWHALSEIACWQIGLHTGSRHDVAPAAKRSNCVCTKCQNTNAETVAMRTGRDSVWHPAYISSLVKSLCVVR